MGFLKYYRLSQLPNFVLAAPLTILSIAALRLGLRGISLMERGRAVSSSPQKTWPSLANTPFGSPEAVPHLTLLALMLVYALTMVHVQIIPRLFSFMPIIPWSLAYFYIHGSALVRRLLLGYCLGTTLIGTILFSNFYPPA